MFLLWRPLDVLLNQVLLWKVLLPDLTKAAIMIPRSGISASAPMLCTRASSTDA